eukprot:876728-Pleurochrysis_carterae.AAC.1
MPELEVQLKLRKELVEHSVSRSADGAEIVCNLLTETRAQLATDGSVGSLSRMAATDQPRIDSQIFRHSANVAYSGV